MKNLIRIFLLVTAMIVFTDTASAQHRRGGERVTREQLAEKQAKHIAEELAFTQEVSDKFIATYLKCQQEIWALGPRHGDQRRHRAHRKRSMTESQVDSIIQSRFDHSQKLLDIRRNYYAEYSKFLTAKQIEKVYELEHKMMKRLKGHRNTRRR